MERPLITEQPIDCIECFANCTEIATPYLHPTTTPPDSPAPRSSLFRTAERSGRRSPSLHQDHQPATGAGREGKNALVTALSS